MYVINYNSAFNSVPLPQRIKDESRMNVYDGTSLYYFRRISHDTISKFTTRILRVHSFSIHDKAVPFSICTRARVPRVSAYRSGRVNLLFTPLVFHRPRAESTDHFCPTFHVGNNGVGPSRRYRRARPYIIKYVLTVRVLRCYYVSG